MGSYCSPMWIFARFVNICPAKSVNFANRFSRQEYLFMVISLMVKDFTVFYRDIHTVRELCYSLARKGKRPFSYVKD